MGKPLNSILDWALCILTFALYHIPILFLSTQFIISFTLEQLLGWNKGRQGQLLLHLRNRQRNLWRKRKGTFELLNLFNVFTSICLFSCLPSFEFGKKTLWIEGLSSSHCGRPQQVELHLFLPISEVKECDRPQCNGDICLQASEYTTHS